MDRGNNGILADTSIWIDFFKPASEIGNRLEAIIMENSVWVSGIVILELVQGVRSEEEKTKILETLSSLKYAEMTKSLWQKSGELSSALRKKGVTIPLSDIILAAISIEYNLQIFTIDKHFKDIPGVKLYPVI